MCSGYDLLQGCWTLHRISLAWICEENEMSWQSVRASQVELRWCLLSSICHKPRLASLSWANYQIRVFLSACLNVNVDTMFHCLSDFLFISVTTGWHLWFKPVRTPVHSHKDPGKYPQMRVQNRIEIGGGRSVFRESAPPHCHIVHTAHVEAVSRASLTRRGWPCSASSTTRCLSKSRVYTFPLPSWPQYHGSVWVRQTRWQFPGSCKSWPFCLLWSRVASCCHPVSLILSSRAICHIDVNHMWRESRSHMELHWNSQEGCKLEPRLDWGGDQGCLKDLCKIHEGGRKGGVKDSEAAAWGGRVFVTWNPDRADRWKGGGVDPQIPELSELANFLKIPSVCLGLSG